jgi:hypothetical protein
MADTVSPRCVTKNTEWPLATRPFHPAYKIHYKHMETPNPLT